MILYFNYSERLYLKANKDNHFYPVQYEDTIKKRTGVLLLLYPGRLFIAIY